MGKQPTTKKKRVSGDYLKYAGLAFQLAAMLMLGIFLGTKADAYMGNNEPYCMLLGCVLAFVLFMVYLLNSLKQDKNNKPADK